MDDIVWDEPDPQWLQPGRPAVPSPTFRKADGTEVPNFRGDEMAAKLRAEAKAAPAEVAANASIPEAIGSGAIQGATFGFSDEIEGAVRSAKDKIFGPAKGALPKSYEEYRDQSRALDAGTRAAHPKAFGAGELGGALATSIVPVGAVAKGAGLGAKAVAAAKTGAAYGAASSAGYSEADNLPDLAADTVKGGAVGAVIGAGTAVAGAGLEKLTEKARVKAAKILRSYFGGGPDVGKTTETIRRKATQGGSADLLEQELAHDPTAQHIAIVARKEPEKAAALIKERIAEIAKPRETLYATLDTAKGHIDPEDYRKFVVDEMKQFAGKNTDQARAKLSLLQEMLDNAETWEGRTLPWAELREHVTDLQSTATGTMGAIAETERRGLAEWRKDVGAKFLNEKLDEAAKGGQKATVEAIRNLNRRFSAWKGVDDMMQTRIVSKNANAWKEKALGGALPGAIGATTEIGRSIANGDDAGQVAKHALIGGAAGFAAGAVANRVVAPIAASAVRNVPIKATQAANLAARIFGKAAVRRGPGAALNAAEVAMPAEGDGITWDP